MHTSTANIVQEHCDCLHRDDSLVQKNIGLRRTRKSLLADLASLIKCRDQIQDTFSGATLKDVSWTTIDEYMAKAFKITCRAVRFLDLWIQGAASTRLRIVSSFDEFVDRPLTSSTTASFSPTSPAHLRIEAMRDATPGADSSDMREQRSSSHSLQSPGANTPEPISTSDLQLTTPLTDTEPAFALGFGSRVEDNSTSDLASERLSAAHDHFLGHVGAFLGLHLQSRTSVDLAAATHRSLEASLSLTAVIKEIWINDHEQSQELSYALTAMHKQLAKLADAAQSLCKNTDPLEDPSLVRPEQGKSLVSAATVCVRCAGDCTGKARQLLDQNGDFVMDMDNVHKHKLAIQIGTEDDAQRYLDYNVSDVTPVAEDGTMRLTEAEAHSRDEHKHGEVAKPPFERRPHARSAATENTNRFSMASTQPESARRPLSSPAPLTIATSSAVAISYTPSAGTPITPSSFLKSPWPTSMRKESLGLSVTDTASTYRNSFRNSNGSAISTSTRATTPDGTSPPARPELELLNSFASVSSMRSAVTVASESSEIEAELLMKSYSHELLFNKEGQVLGGTLRALVEKLTSQHSSPDPVFISTFYLTFRLFTNAIDLANALISRYQYVEDSGAESMPARLRVCNFIKGWLESHWRSDLDSGALKIIQKFAKDKLLVQVPAAGQRLVDLAEKASQQEITSSATQLVSPIGKTIVSLGTQYERENVPSSNISRSQLSSLRQAQASTSTCTIGDFDALEIARQFTLIQSRIFCAIEETELLALEWTKSNHSAVNVRAMARFATDLANLVADSILSVEDVKKRGLTIKQWIKVAKGCLELSNYDCLMAIICSLTSSTILRMKLSWEQVPQKSKAQFEEIKNVMDLSRNYAVLRQRLSAPKAPCLPFLGIYLTDLTFVDAGNQDTRTLPSSDDSIEPVQVINFDKHMRTAKIVFQLQRYQVPYRLQPIPELQSWLEGQMARVHSSESCCVQTFWRRSLQLEPRQPESEIENKPVANLSSGGFKLGHKVSKSGLNGVFTRDKLDFLSTLGFKNEGELKAKIAGAS